MTGEIFLTKAMSTALVLGFFALVIFLLRFLYGPKGVFRDPEWDKWNEEALRQEEAQKAARSGKKNTVGKADLADITALEAAFASYARGFFTGDEKEDLPLKVKLEHTTRVCGHALRIARAEAAFADPLAERALRLAALFHDVARFSQYRRYHTFADALSVNHGAEGARIILAQKFLAGEAPELRRLVLAAVAMHNRMQVPPRLCGLQRDVLYALRDADKLDIMRVLAESLSPGGSPDEVVLMHLKDAPGTCSEPVLEALLQGRVAAYKDMRYYNDFRILLCTWIFDLGFAESRRIMKEEGQLARLVAGLEGIPDVQAQVADIVLAA